MKFSNVRTPLAKARGWGSAHDGTGHFFWQRITALAMIPLTFWFIRSLLHMASGANQVEVVHWLSSGINASLMIILLIAMFYHAKLGVQVIIEDYVHKPVWKFVLLIGNMFLNYGMCVVSVLAVLKLHLHIMPG